jgi:hypothetical protein
MLSVFPYYVFNYIVEPGLLGALVRRDCISSDRDFDMKRGLLTTKRGPDIRNQSSGEPPILSRLPTLSASVMQPQVGWLVEDDVSRGHSNTQPLGFVQDAEPLKPDKQRAHLNPAPRSRPGSTPTGIFSQSQTSQVKVEEVRCECSMSLRYYFLVWTIIFTGDSVKFFFLLICRHVLVMVCKIKIFQLQVSSLVWELAKS